MAKRDKRSSVRQASVKQNRESPKGAERISAAQVPPKTAKHVALIYLAAFLIHVVLNILVNRAPKVVIDEGLYTNIARSLAWDGELAFRGQPVNYPYLLYSFLLVPVYWLNRLTGGDVYRFVQVFNTLLVCSSVFPIFLFARDFTEDDTSAMTAAVLVSLMPDMLMGGFEMTECLIWPFSLWLIFFCYRFYSDQRLSDGLLTALFAGLMFACKPGAVVMGAVLLLFNLLFAFKNRGKVMNTFLSLALLALIVAVVYGVFLLLFDGSGSLLGLYEKQTSEWKSGDALVALEAFFLLCFLFVFACGGIFALFPYTHLKEYNETKRRFVIAVAVGVLAAIAGTAVFVVPYKWDGSLGHIPLHLRYCSMFIPAMFVFTADIIHRSGGGKAYIFSLIAFVLLSIFPGARAGFVVGKTGTIDSLALNAFATSKNLNGNTAGWILTVLVLAFSLIFLCHALEKKTSPGSKKNNAAVANVFFFLFILFNSVCAHINAGIYIDPTISADALQVNRIIGSERCLGITQRYYDDYYSYWLDSRLNVPMQQVTIDQMFLQMKETDGVYSPFVPVEQSPNVNNHATPDTDTFVLGKTIAEHLELSDSILLSEKTANSHFTVVRIRPSTRWVDTMMYGLDDNKLYPSVPAYLHIFDRDRNIDGTLNIDITAAGAGVLNVGGESITVDREVKTFSVRLPFMSDVPISADGGTVQIYAYSTDKISSGS